MTTLNASAQDTYQLMWESMSGNIVSGAETLTPEIEGQGWYLLTAIGMNGCEKTDSILVEEIEGIQSAEVSTDYSCDASIKPSVTITNIIGGAQPYTFDLNGQTNTTGVFTELELGSYTVLITDNNDCRWSEQLTIDERLAIDFYAIEDSFLLLAPDIVSIELVTNLTEIDILIWSPEPDASCINCLNPNINVSSSQNYSVTIYDTNGCSKSIELRIQLNSPDRQYYIPNSFSPDNDGNNDYFTFFFENESQRIEELFIYDRWGNKVFSQEDFDPSDKSNAWDGRYNDKKAEQGVYIYLFRYTDSLGKQEIITANITLF